MEGWAQPANHLFPPEGLVSQVTCHLVADRPQPREQEGVIP